jgi:ABC-type uncharacterized transport system permease subunit
MTALRRMIHQPDPVRQEKISRFTHKLRIAAIALLAGLVLWAVCGCTVQGTPEQQEAARIKRGKNIAKVEARAWKLGGFLADLVGNFVVNSATNYVTEKLGTAGGTAVLQRSAGGRTDRGFRK